MGRHRNRSHFHPSHTGRSKCVRVRVWGGGQQLLSASCRKKMYRLERSCGVAAEKWEVGGGGEPQMS